MVEQGYLPPSELIINADGSIYHLGLLPEQIANTIITVGDPDRVEMITSRFDSIECDVRRREFVTQTGSYKGKRLTVISTGIGTDNVDIVLNELDALVNIDFETRRIKEELTQLTIVRVGTSGTVQADIDVDTFVVSAGAISLDGLLPFYDLPAALEMQEFDQILKKTFSDLPIKTARADADLLEAATSFTQAGVTVTAAGFYAPQGRQLRLKPTYDNLIERLQSLKSDSGLRVTNLEMETAGLYGLGGALGHRMLSLNAILANRVTNVFSSRPKQTVESLIRHALNMILSL